nr:cold-shock protein [Endozoicomonas sp. OPT23]
MLIAAPVLSATVAFGQQLELGMDLNQLTVILLVAGSLLHALSGLGGSSYSGEQYDDYSDSGRETGTVKWFNVSKGFGFITRDSGDDVFVHYRAIRGEGHRTLSEGQRVEFVVVDKDKGLQAEDVIAAARGR